MAPRLVRSWRPVCRSATTPHGQALVGGRMADLDRRRARRQVALPRGSCCRNTARHFCYTSVERAHLVRSGSFACFSIGCSAEKPDVELSPRWCAASSKHKDCFCPMSGHLHWRLRATCRRSHPTACYASTSVSRVRVSRLSCFAISEYRVATAPCALAPTPVCCGMR